MNSVLGIIYNLCVLLVTDDVLHSSGNHLPAHRNSLGPCAGIVPRALVPSFCKLWLLNVESMHEF